MKTHGTVSLPSSGATTGETGCSCGSPSATGWTQSEHAQAGGGAVPAAATKPAGQVPLSCSWKRERASP